MSTTRLRLAGLVAVMLGSAPSNASAQTVLTGEVVDVQCALEKGPAGRGPSHGACAMRCAREGQPMAILAGDELYLVVGDYAARNNAKLLDFVARVVEAKGTISERDGKKVINVSAMMVTKE